MDEGIDPQNMCHHLYGAMGIFHELSAEASQEIVMLFQEWLEMVQAECKAILAETPGVTTQEVAKRLKLSEESVLYLIERSTEK